MSKSAESTKVLAGAAWRFAERITAQAVSFIVSVILARILMPEDYGIIAITTVFITICNVFVTSGFGMALIQKKDADNLDFSTILYFSFGFSLLIYALLYICAPIISSFYNEPILTNVIRIMSLRLPIAAINSVQQAYVARQMIFKKFFLATLIGTVISALIGIVMAVEGYGVWALVAQYLINSAVDTVVLGITIRWRPQARVSFQRLKSMLGFGWRILCSDLIHTVYSQLRSLIIGKRYSTDQLAHYNRGQQIPHLFVTNVGVAISTVLFPAMSAKQDDIEHIRHMIKRSISLGTYVMMPLMAGLAAVARPLITLLLTDKWIGAVPFMQLACLEFCIEPWANANLQALKARGESKTYLRMEFLKKAFAFFLLLVSIPFGVLAIATSGIIYTVVDVIIDTVAIGKYVGYGLFAQLKDILGNILMSIVLFFCVNAIEFLQLGIVVMLLVQICAGIALYLVLSLVTRNENLSYLVQLLKHYVRKVVYKCMNRKLIRK